MKNLVFIGDSLTASYNWQKRFPKYRITNLGISGEPVESLLDRRERIRASIDDPDFIFLMTGINNIAMEQYDITGPYHEIVRDLSTWYKKSVVVIQSILPVALEWISNYVIRDTNRRLEQIARDFSAEYLDVYSLFIDSNGNPKNEYFQDDGVHLTDEGYDVWASEVERFLINV
ncbi:MAG TPA: GDSL-type esterase/lipase family protein [Nitrospirota bacterium]|nr:GDSL-type esterase/lipase family protein [Nitrospirota bacterium]